MISVSMCDAVVVTGLDFLAHLPVLHLEVAASFDYNALNSASNSEKIFLEYHCEFCFLNFKHCVVLLWVFSLMQGETRLV